MSMIRLAGAIVSVYLCSLCCCTSNRISKTSYYANAFALVQVSHHSSMKPLQRRPSFVSSFLVLRHAASSGSNSNSDEMSASMEANATIARTEPLDQLLSKFTLGFPLFVVCAAVMGYAVPSTLLWINRGNIVTLLLAFVMFGTGLTLQPRDFTNIWQTAANRYSVVMGVLCQFIIMPSTAYMVGHALLLQPKSWMPQIHNHATTGSPIASALFLGLCLVGCSPGGTASNVVTYIANANVALSVVLTACSTIAAVVVTPLLIQLLLRGTIYGSIVPTTTSTSITGIASSPIISISGWSLCTSTANVVFVPIICGMLFQSRLPQITATLCRYTPFLSVLCVSMICGGVVAQQTASPLLSSLSGIDTITGLFPVLLTAVVLLHSIGFLAGYAIPKVLLPNSPTHRNEVTARTISIEVGMQNSALAIVLARSIPNLHPIACLPGAISATVHSCLGSLLAAIWRWQSSRPHNRTGKSSKVTVKVPVTEI
jgi:bile acid:Na+ symporter, BASS family